MKTLLSLGKLSKREPIMTYEKSLASPNLYLTYTWSKKDKNYISDNTIAIFKVKKLKK